jgi:AcrR family transcriptional regulator
MVSSDGRLEHLIATATGIFAKQGYHATSMRDLSRASGLSLAGMYHYVRSKDEILFLIQDRCFAEVQAGAEAALDGVQDGAERIRTFIRHHVVFFAGHMDKMKVLSHEDEELTGTMRERVRERKRAYVDLLTGLLQDHGASDLNPGVATYALFGMMNWIYTWYRPDGPVTPESLADDMARLFLTGFLPSTRTATDLVASHGG